MTVEQIREYVDAYIRKNGKRAITGAILNLALQEIVNYAELIESAIGAGTQPDWNATSGLAQILNKPSVFPPASHTHVQSDIAGLVTALATINSNISGLQTLVASDNVNLDTVQELVDAIETIQLSLSTILVNDLTTGGITKALTAQQGVVLKGLIDALTTVVSGKANTSHTHIIANVTGLQTALDGKQPVGSYAAASHTHVQSDIIGLVSALATINSNISGLQALVASDNVNLDSVQELVDAIETIQLSLSTILVNDLVTGGTTKALTAQQGVVLKGLIDALTTVVSGKANTSHTHAISEIVGLVTALAAKQDTLVSQLNIVSVEFNSLVGSGNIELLKNNVVYYFADFANVAATLSPPWSGTAISTGTFTQNTTNFSANTSGVGRITKSTTANSGYRLQTDVNAFRIKGRETFRCRVNFAVFTTLTFRAGFIDTTTNADCVDGCYFELSGSGALVGKNSSNSVRTTSATVANLSLNTWYTFQIIVNFPGTDVSYICLDATGTLIGSGSVATNIPTAVGRETGSGLIATGSSATADVLVDVDYLEQKTLMTRG